MATNDREPPPSPARAPEPAVGTAVQPVAGPMPLNQFPGQVLDRLVRETTTVREFAPPPPPVVRKKRKRKRPISPSLVPPPTWLPDPPTEGRVLQLSLIHISEPTRPY